MSHKRNEDASLRDSLDKALDLLSDDVGSLWAVAPQASIPILERPPSPLTFLRDYVHPSKPCIIRNCIPAQNREGGGGERPLILTLDDLVEICSNEKKSAGTCSATTSDEGDIMLTCDVTPDGHGDCVRSVVSLDLNHSGEPVGMFVKPEERRMTLKQFRDELRMGREEWSKRNNCNCNEDERANDQRDLATFGTKRNTNTTRKRPVIYYSRQNDCLRTELKSLFDASIFPSGFQFAEKAFATGPPDAVNLWIGDQRAVSSMHKDHYENLFYCLSGEKVFTLCPPADIPFLHEGEFMNGTFKFVEPPTEDEIDRELRDCDGDATHVRCHKALLRAYYAKHGVYKTRDGSGEHGCWIVEPDRCQDGDQIQKTRWIEPDVTRLDAAEHFPRLKQAHPVTVKLGEGEMLYLPALWYHRVTQTCETVGVNWWYDMRFDSPSWCYFNFLQHLKVP